MRVTSSSRAPLTWVGMQPDRRALYRLSGHATVDGADRDWSLILKVSRLVAKANDPMAWDYWKREFLAYTSGLLDDPPGIAAPRVLAAREEGELTLLFLEDVAETTSRWPTERYVLAARHLGTFNGAYLGEREIPGHSFLTCGYLRSWTSWLPWTAAVRSDTTWSDPLVARVVGDPPIGRLERLGAAAPKLFDALEDLPQALSHLDAWRANLIALRLPDGRERTVAVDWSFVGTAPAGQEIAILVCGSHIWLDADPKDIARLSDGAFAAYVDGLGLAGWRGDERAVRFAYAASSALYAAPMLLLWLARGGDPARREWLERKCQRPVEEIVRGWAQLLDHVLELADEAYASRFSPN